MFAGINGVFSYFGMCIHMCMYIYIYIEREREGYCNSRTCHVCTCVLYLQREGEGEIQKEYFLWKLSIFIATVSLRGWQAGYKMPRNSGKGNQILQQSLPYKFIWDRKVWDQAFKRWWMLFSISHLLAILYLCRILRAFPNLDHGQLSPKKSPRVSPFRIHCTNKNASVLERTFWPEWHGDRRNQKEKNTSRRSIATLIPPCTISSI